MAGGELRAGPVDDPDRYTLWSVVGGGAEGKVYRATRELADGHLDLAVKVMSPDRFGARGEPAEQVGARWADQAARLRNLRHPGLVGVQEAFLGPPPHPPGESAEGRSAYFVMAWVQGRDLGAWLAGTHLGVDRLGLLSNVADALDELHAAGQVHADVKPGNILVRATALPTGSTMDAAVLVDFGLMRAITGIRPSEVGYTTGYVAPELWQGAPYSPASDLYALAGVVLYSLTGEHPPPSGDVVTEARRRLVAAAVPTVTVDAVAHALQPDPRQRPTGCQSWLGSARAGLSSMTVVMGPDGTSPPPPRPAGADGTAGAEGGASKQKRGALSIALRIALSLTVTATAAVGGAKYAQSDDGGEQQAGGEVVEEEPPMTTTTRQTTTTTSRPTSTTEETTDPTSPPPGRTAWLDELQAVDEGGSAYDGIYPQDDASLNGRVYLHALVGGARCDTATSWVDYDLSRDWAAFTTTVGIEDGSSAGSAVTFTVYLDDQPVASGDVSLGRPASVDVDVAQGLRLRLEIIDRSCGGPDEQEIETQVVFADPQLAA